MAEPIVIYGATDCDDTERTAERLGRRGVPFELVNIDANPDAERFVLFVNGGFRSTPTLLIGAGKIRTLATEPDDAQIDLLAERAGYDLQRL
jgi:mycoredoxin